MLAVASELQLNFPEEIKIFGLEVVDPYTIGEGLSEAGREAIPALKQKVVEQLERWRKAMPKMQSQSSAPGQGNRIKNSTCANGFAWRDRS